MVLIAKVFVYTVAALVTGFILTIWTIWSVRLAIFVGSLLSGDRAWTLGVLVHLFVLGALTISAVETLNWLRKAFNVQ